MFTNEKSTSDSMCQCVGDTELAIPSVPHFAGHPVVSVQTHPAVILLGVLGAGSLDRIKD